MSLRIFQSIDLSSTGLRAQRSRLEVVSENIANAETTRTEEGGPYRRKRVVMRADEPELLSSRPGGAQRFDELLLTHQGHLDTGRLADRLRLATGAEVTVEEAPDAGRFRQVFDPGHPDADEQGYVLMPNVDVVSEMVDMVAASRAYEANISAIESAKAMFLQALEI